MRRLQSQAWFADEDGEAEGRLPSLQRVDVRWVDLGSDREIRPAGAISMIASYAPPGLENGMMVPTTGHRSHSGSAGPYRLPLGHAEQHASYPKGPSREQRRDGAKQRLVVL
jgi:hypothetical protein